MQIDIFIQARMGSTRLPGKILKSVLGRPLLFFLLERLKGVKKASSCTILTTTHPLDDITEDFCNEYGVPYYRGPEENVLKRYYEAACEKKSDAIIRITADCPLMDSTVVDQLIDVYVNNFPKYDYVSNALERTFPRGLDIEIFSFNALEKAYFSAQDLQEQEHVTLYMYRHPELFSLKNVSLPEDFSQYRLTVDTPEDFTLIQLLLEELYPKNPHFTMQETINLLQAHPEWILINGNVLQKKVHIPQQH